MSPTSYPQLRLPKDWPRPVKSAILHVISLAQFAIAYPLDPKPGDEIA